MQQMRNKLNLVEIPLEPNPVEIPEMDLAIGTPLIGYGTTNIGYGTTNADAGVGIGMKRGIRKFRPLICR